MWDRRSGQPIYNAIVWQDRRTADRCAELARTGHADFVSERTGLVLDPYFSATKIGWILDSVPGARERAARGELAFGTVDAFLLWRLTNGAVHATDVTNASRTSLLNYHSAQWDDDLLALFDVPRSMLPELRDTAGSFGAIDRAHLGAALPVHAMVGDQQSALIGQVCLEPGMAKATYGTGGFILFNTGASPCAPGTGSCDHRLSVGRRAPLRSRGVDLLRGLDGAMAARRTRHHRNRRGSRRPRGRIRPGTGSLSRSRVRGIGAPHWRADARAAILGLTRERRARNWPVRRWKASATRPAICWRR